MLTTSQRTPPQVHIRKKPKRRRKHTPKRRCKRIREGPIQYVDRIR